MAIYQLQCCIPVGTDTATNTGRNNMMKLIKYMEDL